MLGPSSSSAACLIHTNSLDVSLLNLPRQKNSFGLPAFFVRAIYFPTFLRFFYSDPEIEQSPNHSLQIWTHSPHDLVLWPFPLFREPLITLNPSLGRPLFGCHGDSLANSHSRNSFTMSAISLVTAIKIKRANLTPSLAGRNEHFCSIHSDLISADAYFFKDYYC